MIISVEAHNSNSNEKALFDAGYLMQCPAMSSLGIGKIIFLNHRLQKQSRTMEIIGIHEHLLALFTSMKLHMVLKIRGN